VIDFRYHLVSIVAVFLALAVGIAIGAGALQNPTLKALNRTSRAQEQQVESLLATERRLQHQIGSDQVFAQAGSQVLLSRLLDGQRVVLVSAPGADGQTISGVTTALRQAGAQVIGQVGLQQSFFDTTAVTETALRTLAQGMAPGLSLGTDPASPQITGQQAAAQVIASALVTGKPAGWTATQSHSILAGFAQRGYLQVSNAGAGGGTALTAPATLAVVITPAAPPPASASGLANLALIAVAQQLQAASHGTVVAGSLPGSGAGSAISQICGSGLPLTTVDYADGEIGQIAVAQALSFLLNGHKSACYGSAPAAFPSPAPTPAPTTVASPPTTGPHRPPARTDGRSHAGSGRPQAKR
jgi:hypothetical protein